MTFGAGSEDIARTCHAQPVILAWIGYAHGLTKIDYFQSRISKKLIFVTSFNFKTPRLVPSSATISMRSFDSPGDRIHSFLPSLISGFQSILRTASHFPSGDQHAPLGTSSVIIRC